MFVSIATITLFGIHYMPVQYFYVKYLISKSKNEKYASIGL